MAPAGRAPDELVDQGLEVLRGWGLEVLPGRHLRDRHPVLDYLAGTDRDRAADLARAWCDPTVSAVLCVRGGYGCLRTLQHLDPGTLDAMAAAEPTILAGSSDVTALHTVLGARCDVATLFAPMIGTAAFLGVEATREHLRRTLFDPAAVTVLRGPSAATLVGGRARGVLAGGNLSLLTSAPPPPDGAIAILEDVTEAPYRIDHFLTDLLRAGWFDPVAGIALGSWHECGPPGLVRDVLADRLGPLGVPIVWELGFGHGPHQLTVPLGVVADLDADAATLTLITPALT